MLSRRSRLVLDTLLPAQAHPTLPDGIFDAGFDKFLLDFQSTASPVLRRGFWAALFAATWIAPLLIFRLPPLTRLERPVRERALLAMETSRVYLLRQMMLLLKSTVCFCYGADSDVRDAIGYPRQHDDARQKATE
jgi:hypothetical protein